MLMGTINPRGAGTGPGVSYILIPYQQKRGNFGNLTSGCYGNTIVRVMSKSLNPAKIILLGSMETKSHDNLDKI